MLLFDHVSKSFGELRAVDDLSFELEAGEVFGLLGPNGAGKTTAINMAVGLLEPDAGVVRFTGEAFDLDPREADNRGALGLAFTACPAAIWKTGLPRVSTLRIWPRSGTRWCRSTRVA